MRKLLILIIGVEQQRFLLVIYQRVFLQEQHTIGGMVLKILRLKTQFSILNQEMYMLA